ncbi:MAG: hypothetical protein OEZ02_10700 [Anaerolineae bacterium]|nr:hypothetical protein [Anaerolineae bacterium]
MQPPNSEDTQPGIPVPPEDNTSNSLDQALPTSLPSSDVPLPETQPLMRENDNSAPPVTKRPWGRWILFGLIGYLFIGGLAALGANQVGSARIATTAQWVAAVEAVKQFNWGIQDLENGRCDNARIRFQFIIENYDPTYPGVQKNYINALICLDSTAPLATANPEAATITPTPDTRGAEEKFSLALQLLANEEWDTLLDTLDSLRKNNPNYRPIDIDGLYYLAHRSRGVDRILIGGNLEGGIFDLNRAEKIGPLDSEAAGYRQWATLYLNGLSFWGIDWGQAVYYFGQLVQLAPNVWDGSYYAQDRLATAQVGYSEQLIRQAEAMLTARGWCEAHNLYKEAAEYAPLEPIVVPTADWAEVKCRNNP